MNPEELTATSADRLLRAGYAALEGPGSDEALAMRQVELDVFNRQRARELSEEQQLCRDANVEQSRESALMVPSSSSAQNDDQEPAAPL